MVTPSQEKILAITPKCCASLSIPFSVFLIYEVWCDHKTRGTTPIQRALVGMSVVDILSSSAWFMSSWAVPKDTWAFAAGNMATCNYQGFLLQLAIGAPLFNASLGLYYALMIRLKWTDRMLATIEYWVQGFIWTFSIGTSILLLPLKQYNPIGQVCWIIGSPADCGDSTHISNPDVPCERGDHAWLYGVLLFYGPLWICVFCCLVCMYFVYKEVSATMRKVRQYAFDAGSSSNIGRNEIDAVAIQAILYSLSFFITWMPSTLWSVAHWFRFAAFWLDFLSAFCEPLQGMWNFLIFIRARRRTKVKIQNAFATVFPWFIQKASLTQVSREHSGNGRRSTGKNSHIQSEEYKMRTSNLGVSSSLYRNATLKANQMNQNMFGSESLHANTGDVSSRFSVKFDDDGSSVGKTAIPESSLVTTLQSLQSKSIPEVDEEPMSSALDPYPTAEFTTKDSCSSSSAELHEELVPSTPRTSARYGDKQPENQESRATRVHARTEKDTMTDSLQEGIGSVQPPPEPRICDEIPVFSEAEDSDEEALQKDQDGSSVSSFDKLESKVRMYFM